MKPGAALAALAVAGALATGGPFAALAAPPADAAALLSRLQAAARAGHYEGTLVYTAGEVVSSSRVAHFAVGGHWFERIEALDGREQRVFRHNDLVHSFWPRSKVVTVETRDPATAGALLAQIEARVADHYELRMVGRDRIAGRDAQVLLLKARDDLRFTQRLWADTATGLMLRADVLGAQGAVMESSAFSQVVIGGRPMREEVTAPMHRLAGYRVVDVSPTPTHLHDEGWQFVRLPAGFKLAGSVRRLIDPVGGAGENSPALHVVFSDGLARVSVFIEPLVPGRPRQPLMTQLGATHTLMKPHGGGHWVTLMGDVPAPTLKAFLVGLERRP